MPLVKNFENASIRRMVFVSGYTLEQENTSISFVGLNRLSLQADPDKLHNPGPIFLFY